MTAPLATRRYKRCQRCGQPLDGKRPQAKWCGTYCANRAWHEKRKAALAYRRPRCLICNAPIRWGKPGVRHNTRTCGKHDCVRKAYAWFVRG